MIEKISYTNSLTGEILLHIKQTRSSMIEEIVIVVDPQVKVSLSGTEILCLISSGHLKWLNKYSLAPLSFLEGFFE